MSKKNTPFRKGAKVPSNVQSRIAYMPYSSTRWCFLQTNMENLQSELYRLEISKITGYVSNFLNNLTRLLGETKITYGEK